MVNLTHLFSKTTFGNMTRLLLYKQGSHLDGEGMTCLNSNPTTQTSLVHHLLPNNSMQVALNHSHYPWTVC